MSHSHCCVEGFSWNGKPTGTESKLANNPAYVTGTNKDAAVLVIHDVWGWTWQNMRLLADHYATEAQATVYVPDLYVYQLPSPSFFPFSPLRNVSSLAAEEGAALTHREQPHSFGGEIVPLDTDLRASTWNIDAFFARHNKEIRGPELVACVKALREEHGFKKVGAVGFCYGGWAVLSLGAEGKSDKQHTEP